MFTCLRDSSELGLTWDNSELDGEMEIAETGIYAGQGIFDDCLESVFNFDTIEIIREIK